MRNLMLVCAGLALIGGIASVSLWRQLHTERELTARLQAPMADAGERKDVPALPVQPVVIAASVGSAAPAGKPQSPVTAQAGDKAITQMVNQILANDAALAKDPEYRNARLAQLRLRIPQDYPGLAEKLGLTPGEADKLFDLLAETQSAKMIASTSNVIIVQPGDPSPESVTAIQEVMRARQEIDRRREESLVSMLGNARYQQFKDYEAERPARNRVNTLGQTLAAAGQPLSEAQTRPLVEAFHAADKRRQELSQKMVGERQPGAPVDQARIDEALLDLDSENNRRILEAARSHLSAQQLDTLRATLEQPLARDRAAARVRREQSAAQGQ